MAVAGNRSKRSSARQSELACGADVLGYEEQALGESAVAIKQDVVEERVFVGQAETGADYGLVIFLRIPSDADLRSEIFVGLLHAAAQTSTELIDEICLCR